MTETDSSLDSVVQGVLSMFHGVKTGAEELQELCDQFRDVYESDLRPFIITYYKTFLLPEAMDILRESVEGETSEEIQCNLCECWKTFNQEYLPRLNMIFCDLQHEDLTVVQIAYLAFRDKVVLKLNLEETLQTVYKSAFPSLQEMFLVLQGIQECWPPSRNYMRLEELVVMVVWPYLGYRGLYEECDELTIPSKQPAIPTRKTTFHLDEDDDEEDAFAKSKDFPQITRHPERRRSSLFGLLPKKFLSSGEGRRHTVTLFSPFKRK